jgi:hypothetical protein
MNIRIPIDYAGVTLKQYVAYKTAQDDIERVMAVTGFSHKQVRELKMETIRFIVTQMDEVLLVERASRIIDGKRWIRIEGREYGLITDLEQIQFSEFVDAHALSNAAFTGEQPDLTNLIDLFCVLWRPITERVRDQYRVIKYDSDKIQAYRKDIEQMPMDIVSGTLLFFSIISSELLTASQAYLTQEMNKSMEEAMMQERPVIPHSPEATGGITFFKRLRSVTSQSMTRFLRKKPTKYSRISAT